MKRVFIFVLIGCIVITLFLIRRDTSTKVPRRNKVLIGLPDERLCFGQRDNPFLLWLNRFYSRGILKYSGEGNLQLDLAKSIKEGMSFCLSLRKGEILPDGTPPNAENMLRYVNGIKSQGKTEPRLDAIVSIEGVDNNIRFNFSKIDKENINFIYDLFGKRTFEKQSSYEIETSLSVEIVDPIVDLEDLKTIIERQASLMKLPIEYTIKDSRRFDLKIKGISYGILNSLTLPITTPCKDFEAKIGNFPSPEDISSGKIDAGFSTSKPAGLISVATGIRKVIFAGFNINLSKFRKTTLRSRLGKLIETPGKIAVPIEIFSRLNDPIENSIATRLANRWRALGCNMSIKFLASEDYTQRLKNGNFEVVIGSIYEDSSFTVYNFFHSLKKPNVGSYLGYSSHYLDKLIEELDSSFEIEKRRQLVQKIKSYLAEDGCIVFLEEHPVYFVASNQSILKE
jgi:hypothetical protein